MSNDQDNKGLDSLQNNVQTWLAELNSIPADPNFLKERNQPQTPVRKIFD